MHYMGINYLEEYLDKKAEHFYKNSTGRSRIAKIIMPEHMYNAVLELSDTGRMLWSVEKGDGTYDVLWFGIPIECSEHAKDLIIVPEGALSESIYE